VNTVNPFYEIGSNVTPLIMRLASIPIAFMTLVLLIAVPVGGAPSLNVGSSAAYNVSVTASFSPPYCGTNTTSGSQSNIIYCPLAETNFPSVGVNGTLGWTTTGLNATTAVLNVTRDLATFFAGNLTTPVFRNARSFNESINLADRTVSIMPFIDPEMDQAMQSLLGMSSWAPSMSTISSALWIPRPIYTMWWVNGPLKLNETVPVLVFPTNVTRSTSLSLANIGTRSAWTLPHNLTLPSPEQDGAYAYAMPTGDNLFASFTFNYDQTSGLLLSATAIIHFGFLEPLPYLPSPCVSSGTTVCPASSTYPTFVQSGANINATLTLSKTNLIGSSDPGTNSGSNPATNAGSGPGPASSENNGIPGQGPGSSSGDTGTNGGTGSKGGSNQPSTPQSTAAIPIAEVPWIFWIVAIVAAAIAVTGIVFARRRVRKN
jgi:hypothetical protein